MCLICLALTGVCDVMPMAGEDPRPLRLAHLERGYLEVAGNDLKEISPAKSQYNWSINHKFFNKMMHPMNGKSCFCLLLMIELCLAFVMGPGYMSSVTYGESFTPTFNDFFFGAMVALLLRLSRVRCFPKSFLAMMSFTLGACKPCMA